MSSSNIASFLSQTAQVVPDKVFLMVGEQQLTFAEVERQACRVACVLDRLGVQPGDVAALLLPNSPLFPICYYAALKLGAAVMPLHARSAGPEIGFALRDAGATVLISAGPLSAAALQGWNEVSEHCRLVLAGVAAESSPGDVAPAMSPLPPQVQRLEPLLEALTEADAAAIGIYPVAPEADAILLFTSGTTDRPKGVRLSHGTLSFSVPQFARLCGLSHEDVLLLFMPATVIPGQLMLNTAALLGAALSLMPVFDPQQLFQTIERHRVTFFPMVPMVAQMMLGSPAAQAVNLSSLRGVMIGATAVPPELVARFTERFNVPVIVPYGLTECSTVALALPGTQFPIGSVGKPIPETQLRIVDDAGSDLPPGQPGEILVRSPNVMQGYLNRPQETAAAFVDGWLRTGDFGYLDEQGFLFIIERISDLIKTAGNRVSPAEVERVLELHPAVAQAAVVGQPHSQLGELIQAFVVLKPGAQVTDQELRAHCRQHLTSFKQPRKIVFVEQLPRNPTGKVLRRMLRDGVRSGA